MGTPPPSAPPAHFPSEPTRISLEVEFNSEDEKELLDHYFASIVEYASQYLNQREKLNVLPPQNISASELYLGTISLERLGSMQPRFSYIFNCDKREWSWPLNKSPRIELETIGLSRKDTRTVDIWENLYACIKNKINNMSLYHTLYSHTKGVRTPASAVRVLDLSSMHHQQHLGHKFLVLIEQRLGSTPVNLITLSNIIYLIFRDKLFMDIDDLDIGKGVEVEASSYSKSPSDITYACQIPRYLADLWLWQSCTAEEQLRFNNAQSIYNEIMSLLESEFRIVTQPVQREQATNLIITPTVLLKRTIAVTISKHFPYQQALPHQAQAKQ